MTIPLIFALEAADAEFRERLGRYYTGGAQAVPDAVGELVRGIAAAGGLSRTRDAIGGYVERAKMSLAPLGGAAARAELVALADAVARESTARAR